MFFCVYDFWLACMYIQPYACLVFSEVKRGYQVSLNWKYEYLLSTMWVLETKPMSSERAPSAFYCWVISLAQGIQFWVSPLLHWVRIFIPQDGLCEDWSLKYHSLLSHLPALISDLVQARQCVRRLEEAVLNCLMNGVVWFEVPKYKYKVHILLWKWETELIF